MLTMRAALVGLALGLSIAASTSRVLPKDKRIVMAMAASDRLTESEASNAQERKFCDGCRNNGADHDLLGQVQCGRNPCRRCSADRWIIALCGHVQFIPADSATRGSVLIGPERAETSGARGMAD